jgi:hypothetical protein
MADLILPCECIFNAGFADKSQLEKIEHELTMEDFEEYYRLGWKCYHPDNHIEYLLPSLGETMYFRSAIDPVVEINGKRWKIKVQWNDRYPIYEPDSVDMIFTETQEPLSQSELPCSKNRFDFYIQVFGQPNWVQSEFFPTYKGKLCSHLMTIETRWGDSGNHNFLLGCGDNGNPEVVYFEASCC